MKKQFTASLFILENKKILLIFHKKHEKWIQPGGHMEPGELPNEAAIREANEETGLTVQLMKQENIWVKERQNSASFPRPYLCLVENIPPFEGNDAHQHVDFIYVGRPVGGQLTYNAGETKGLKWFSYEDLQMLKKGEEIFEDTYEICMHLLEA